MGEEAQRKRGMLKLHYPIQRGIITNWDEMVTLWRHTFDQLPVKPEETFVFLPEKPFNPKANKERTVQVKGLKSIKYNITII